jgi:hypothetical protein
MLSLSMSAFRGKADIPDTPHQCPLMTHSGHGQELIEYAVVQEIKDRHRTWVVEIVGTSYDAAEFASRIVREFARCIKSR